MAGARAVGAAGRGWGSSYAGSAGRRSCVRVGTRCSPPVVRGGPVARGVRGRALSPLRLPSSWGLSGPAGHVLWARVRGPALSPWPVFPVCLRGGQPGFRGPRVRCEGRLLPGAPPPPTVRPLRGLSGSVIHSCCGRGCAGVGAHHCPLGLHALWGLRAAGLAGGHPPGVGQPPLRGASGVMPCPSPAARPLGRAAGVPQPVCPGCGRCGRGDPAPAPQRVPLRAGVARCGGGGRASLGGVPSTVPRSIWGQALPLPRLPAHWAGCWGPLPTCCGRGRVGVGVQHCPLGLQALWGLRAAGMVGGRPREGWPSTVVRGAWCQAPFLPRPSVLWGGQPGFCDPCVPGAVAAGVGTQHRLHSVRPCGPALLTVGLAEGRPWEGCLPPL